MGGCDFCSRPAEAEAIRRLRVEAYRPEREWLHPSSGIFRETGPDMQRAMDEGTVYVARRGADIVGRRAAATCSRLSL